MQKSGGHSKKPGSNLRIAIVSPMYSEVGGLAVQAQELGKHFSEEGIGISNIPVRNLDGSWKDRVPVIRTIYQYKKRLHELNRIQKTIGGVIILSCSGSYFSLVTAPVVRWCVRRGIPVVLSHRGGDTEKWFARSRKTPAFFSSIARKCAAVHVSSPYLARVLDTYGIDCKVVPIIIDISRFKYRPRPAKADLIVNTRTMGRNHGAKLSVLTIACLSKIYPQSTLLLAGDGSDHKICRELVIKMGLEDRTKFPGRLSREGIAGILDRGDILLNTSIHDNIPNAILEGFASGIPVISSAVGGIPDLIGKDERGILVEGRDPNTYADKIREMVGDKNRTVAQVEKAYAWVKDLSWESQRDAYLDTLINPITKKIGNAT